MIERGAQHLRLMITHPLTFLALQPGDVGDIRLQDDRTPAGGTMLAGLKPTVAGYGDVKNNPGFAVLFCPFF
ncbi:MAG: hypothetical protein ACPGGK_09660 [Pikeienuella sp.]